MNAVAVVVEAAATRETQFAVSDCMPNRHCCCILMSYAGHRTQNMQTVRKAGMGFVDSRMKGCYRTGDCTAAAAVCAAGADIALDCRRSSLIERPAPLGGDVDNRTTPRTVCFVGTAEKCLCSRAVLDCTQTPKV
jgi:hypothetical protein